MLGSYIPNLIELEAEEEIIFVTATTDYQGKLLFVYENGKLAKVPMEVYATKTNRKKLVKAYSDLSALVRIMFFADEAHIALYRTYNKNERTMLIVHTELITEKVTKNTQGIQVMRLKKGSALTDVHLADDEFRDKYKAYIVDKVPMSGKEIESKLKIEQMQLF